MVRRAAHPACWGGWVELSAPYIDATGVRELSAVTEGLTFQSGRRFTVVPMTTYQISQLAERCGVSASTLRFYEGAGLLPAERTASGYRLYGPAAVEQLEFISSAKLLGLSLDEIRDLLTVRADGVCATVRERMAALLAAQIAEADSRVAELAAFSARLTGVLADLSAPARAGACGPDCGCTTSVESAAIAPGPVPVTLSRTRHAPDPESEAWRTAPVTCTLDTDELDVRITAWRQLVAGASGREDIPDGVQLAFPASPELAAEVAALAAAEQDCCSFFDFDLHLAVGEIRLTIRAPESAAGMLTDLLGTDA
jgi:DNA-binding transcriptional MerR regulator